MSGGGNDQDVIWIGDDSPPGKRDTSSSSSSSSSSCSGSASCYDQGHGSDAPSRSEHPPNRGVADVEKDDGLLWVGVWPSM